MNETQENYDSVQIAETFPQAETNKPNYTSIFEHAPCGFVTLTPEGAISAINSKGMELIGAPDEKPTKTTFIEYIDPDYHGSMVQALQNTVLTGKTQTAELKMANLQEEFPSWLRADVSAQMEPNGHLKQWQLSLLSMSNTQKKCQELKKELENKNLLMRELNHRIANNLMMISSLIMQKEADEGRNEDLDEIRYQIEAIRYVHEFLQKSSEHRDIDMQVYLKELLSTIFSYFIDEEIEVLNKISEINLPTQTAMYVGLIVNEVASNAIKYGFNHKEKPRFSVNFKETEDKRHYRLELSNSGNPFPENIDISHSDSLGLGLIASLADDLGGVVELQRYPHTVFTICFPKEVV